MVDVQVGLPGTKYCWLMQINDDDDDDDDDDYDYDHDHDVQEQVKH